MRHVAALCCSCGANATQVTGAAATCVSCKRLAYAVLWYLKRAVVLLQLAIVHIMSHSGPHSPSAIQPDAAAAYSHLLVAGDGPSVEFDEALGAYMGIPAMSNRDDSFFSGERCCPRPRRQYASAIQLHNVGSGTT